MKTAVLLVIFKRPDLTERIMEVLRRVKPRRLYVAADAARPGRHEETLCGSARAIAVGVDWPCEVFTDFAPKNLGSGHRVATAITWMFQTEEEGIILEDDCLPDDTFFRFCEEMLEGYRDNERVMVVAGYHGPAVNAGDLPSYWFSRYTITWGWATWRRAWRHHDIQLASKPVWAAFKDSAQLREICPDPAERAYWVQITDISLSKYDAWDYQWTMTCWMHRALCVIPSHNLIENIGFRADAEHTTDDLLGLHRTVLRPMEWPLRHPAAVVADEVFDRKTWLAMYKPLTFFQRVHRKLLRIRESIPG